MSNRSGRVLLILVLLAVVLVPVASADGHPRIGFGSNGLANQYDWESLGGTWYQVWGNGAAYHLDGMQFYPMVAAYGELWGTETYDTLAAKIAARPENYPDGTVWIISNELYWDKFTTIDGVPLNPPRAITSDEYAQKYKKYRDIIKQLNPTFKTAIAFAGSESGEGVTLRNVVAAYQARYGVKMPIDVYNLHAYAFGGSQDFERIFIPAVTNYRQVMADIGERDKPLILTEVGVLEGMFYETVPDSYVHDFMRRAFDWMRTATSDTLGLPSDGNHLVQKWAWFALTGWSPDQGNDRWERTALFDYDTKASRELAQVYTDYVRAASAITVSLAPGWNLLSIPLKLTSTSVADVLAPIAGKYDSVYTYDNCASTWRTYTPGGPSGDNTLTTLDERIGFWVHTTSATSLTLSGQPLTTTSISLCPGWNLISYPVNHQHVISAPLNGIAGKYTEVLTFVATDAVNPWRRAPAGVPTYAADLPEFIPGYGYWINATVSATLVITE